MVESRCKSDPLSATTKGYLQELYIAEVYGRQRDITNKYLEKGTLVEEDSLTLASKHYKKLLIKNKEWFQNDLLCGTPDVIRPNKIIDIKSSWDIWSFAAADGTNKDYYWQLQGYMNLKGRSRAELVYCLVNTPEHLIVSEKNKLIYKLGLDESSEAFIEAEAEIERNMTFDDIPERKRVKVFKFKYDQSAIDRLTERIYLCRDYLNSLTI